MTRAYKRHCRDVRKISDEGNRYQYEGRGRVGDEQMKIIEPQFMQLLSSTSCSPSKLNLHEYCTWIYFVDQIVAFGWVT